MKQVFIAVSLILFLGAGFIAWKTFPSTHRPVASQTTTQQVQGSPQPDRKSAAQALVVAGTYSDYSETKRAKAQGTILLFFHAPWCPQCVALDSDIRKQDLPDNLTILKVDYDSNQTLRRRYGVTLQTTIVKVNQAGEKLTAFTAYQEPTFASIKRELL